MIKKIFVLLIFFLPLSNLYAEKDCIYDQKTQREYYQGLCKEYKNCLYLESENKVIIKRGDETIEIKRGGCVDFGVSVTLTFSVFLDYNKSKVVLMRALSLADEFWHDYVSGRDLRELLQNKKHQLIKTDSGYHYLFSHESVSELMIDYSFSEGKHLITISYYTNI